MCGTWFLIAGWGNQAHATPHSVNEKVFLVFSDPGQLGASDWIKQCPVDLENETTLLMCGAVQIPGTDHPIWMLTASKLLIAQSL